MQINSVSEFETEIRLIARELSPPTVDKVVRVHLVHFHFSFSIKKKKKLRETSLTGDSHVD